MNVHKNVLCHEHYYQTIVKSEFFLSNRWQRLPCQCFQPNNRVLLSTNQMGWHLVCCSKVTAHLITQEWDTGSGLHDRRKERGREEKKKEKQTRSCPLVSLTNYNVRYLQLATSLIESYLYNLDLSKLVSLTLPLFLKIKPPLLSFHPLFRAQNRSAKLDYNFSYEPINPLSWKNPQVTAVS